MNSEHHNQTQREYNGLAVTRLEYRVAKSG